MPRIEIDTNNEALFANLIARAATNEPNITDVLFEYPNAIDALEIANMLKVNKTITKIELSHSNTMGIFGIEYIADSLKNNTRLRSLYLTVNSLSREDLEPLFQALINNKKITDLNLSHNNMQNIGADRLIEVLELNKIITDINIDSNLISPSRLTRIHALITKNREFLNNSINDAHEGRDLTDIQLQTLVAHSMESESRYAIFKKTQETILNRDLTGEVLNFSTIEDTLSFNAAEKSENFLGRQGKSPAEIYFRGTVKKITPCIKQEYINMVDNAGDLLESIKLKNNIIFIADALNNHKDFDQITANLQLILNNPKAKEFALNNPKKLGYLITIDKKKLNKAVGIINHPILGAFTAKNPEQIATLIKASDDPEKLLRVVLELERNPNLRTVKTLASLTEKRWAKSYKTSKAAESRSSKSQRK